MTMTRVSPPQRRPLSLNSRVMLFVAVAISLSLFTIGHLVQNAVERHFAEQDADELKVITQAVVTALQKASTDGLDPTAMLASAVSGHHGVYFQVWNPRNRLVYGPSDMESTQPTKLYAPKSPIHSDHLYIWQVKGITYRGAITNASVDGRDYRIVAAIDMDFHLHFLQSFGRSLWIIMTLAGGITLLAAWYGVHRGHAPLRGLSSAMRAVQADRLHLRLESEEVPAELKTLVDSFNRMISRLEDSFDRLSHFSADIAHELRTPLTNLITQTQVSLSRSRSLMEYRELLYSNLEEQERLSKMVNDMLWLAQNEQGLLKPVWEPLDLKREVGAVFEFFEALAEEKQIRLTVEGPPSTLVGDQAMLRRALSNLIANAIRYTPVEEEIRVRVGSREDQSVLLSVENPGPNIPAEHLPRLFDRFYRVDPSRQREREGAGLGLAIVKSIIDAHEGNIEVTSERGVTRFSIRFPRESNVKVIATKGHNGSRDQG